MKSYSFRPTRSQPTVGVSEATPVDGATDRRGGDLVDDLPQHVCRYCHSVTRDPLVAGVDVVTLYCCKCGRRMETVCRSARALCCNTYMKRSTESAEPEQAAHQGTH